MDEKVSRIIQGIRSLEQLSQFEANAEKQKAVDAEMKAAIRAKRIELGRDLVTERTGLDLTQLTPAEEKIVEAVAEYVAIQRQAKKGTPRTFNQLRNRGLLEAAEIAVSKSKPTQGFETLVDADLADLSYEQIIVDHPEEFTPRALWYARRALKLPNNSEKPPAKGISPTQSRTVTLLQWLEGRAAANGGRIPRFTNADSATALGMADMHRYGRVFGNIQSRVDFACYKADLPPLGLAADAPFDKAWGQDDRTWAIPVPQMQAAAQSHIWSNADFAAVLRETEKLSGQAHIIWKDELARNEAGVKAWAFGLSEENRSTGAREVPIGEETESKRNPPWSRDELVLALDLYLKDRFSPPGPASKEVVELSDLLGRMAVAQGRSKTETFRNPNGVYMKMLNFRRFDPEFTSEGKTGLTRGNKEEEPVWNDYASDPAKLAQAIFAIRAEVSGSFAKKSADQSYWVLVCNPKKWAIDQFIDRGRDHDTWGVRPSDRERFAPGQLAIVRVGVDRRSAEERKGKPPLDAGIYALCEIESEAYDGTGAGDEFWAPGEGREPGWPTVKVRYLRSYFDRPLTIEKLRAEKPDISPLLLNGFQAASFPIPPNDFRAVMDLLGESEEELPQPVDDQDVTIDKLAVLEKQFLRASPEVKEKLSKTIERGKIGALVKKANGFKCQLCETMGRNPISFLKKNGDPYVEAHHVMPVWKKEIGSLSASNVMTLCANHHREVHYGDVQVTISDSTFDVLIAGKVYQLKRLRLDTETKAADKQVELVA